MTGRSAQQDLRRVGGVLVLAVLLSAACSSSNGSGGGGGSGGSASGKGGAGGSSGPAQSSSTGTFCGVVGTGCCPGDVCNAEDARCIEGMCRQVVPFGGECSQDAECEDRVCLDLGRCSKPCASADVCPPGPEWTCGPIAGHAGDVCACAPSGADVCNGRDDDCDGVVDGGSQCAQPGFTCQSGACACDPAGLCDGVCKVLASDPSNCGACGIVCDVDAACLEGHCLTTLASGEDTPFGLAVDGTHVYWTTFGGGTVNKIPKDGGVPVTLASGQTKALGAVVDASHVYFLIGGAMTGAVRKVPLGGGAPTTLASGLTYPEQLALDATHVYWTGGSPEGTVQSTTLGGGAPALLATDAFADTWGIAVDATHVYFAGYDTLSKVALGGGAVTELATATNVQPSFSHVAVDTTSVYWATEHGILRVPKGGGPGTFIAGSDGFESGLSPSGVAVDASYVYWTDSHLGPSGSVMKVPLGGGTPTTLASGQLGPWWPAVDATSVYWVTYDGNVMKAPK